MLIFNRLPEYVKFYCQRSGSLRPWGSAMKSNNSSGSCVRRILDLTAPFFPAFYALGLSAEARGFKKHTGSFIMIRRLVLAGLAMATAGAVATAEAQQAEKWVLLGTKEVSAKAAENEVIELSKGGTYKAIRVQNKAGDTVSFNKSKIVYGDNSVHLEERNINLQAGQKSRPLDPRTGNRSVSSVAVSLTQKPATKTTSRSCSRRCRRAQGRCSGDWANPDNANSVYSNCGNSRHRVWHCGRRRTVRLSDRWFRC
jgi:hypothetical protein